MRKVFELLNLTPWCMVLDVVDTALGRETYLAYAYAESKQKRDIIEHLNKPRSTIDRDVRLLEQAELLTRTTGGYQSTPLGRLVVDELTELSKKCEGFQAADDLLSHLPDDRIHPEMFVDATVIRPKRSEPLKPIHRLFDLVRGSDYFVSITPTIFPEYFDLLSKHVLQKGGSTELIVGSDALTRFISIHQERTEDLLDTSRLRIYETDSISFGLTLIGKKPSMCCLSVYSESGIEGLVTNCSQQAIDCATKIYDEFLTEARTITNRT